MGGFEIDTVQGMAAPADVAGLQLHRVGQVVRAQIKLRRGGGFALARTVTAGKQGRPGIHIQGRYRHARCHTLGRQGHRLLRIAAQRHAAAQHACRTL
jgi:hypothetical protein